MRAGRPLPTAAPPLRGPASGERGAAPEGDAAATIERGGGVLFVCTHNATRSPMAGALYRRILGEGRAVATAGVYGAAPIDPFAAEAMRELGVDLSRHHARTLADIELAGGDVAAFDAIVALSPAAAQRARDYGGPDAAVELWPIADPTQTEGDDATRLAAYRTLREGLARRIRERFVGPARRDRSA